MIETEHKNNLRITTIIVGLLYLLFLFVTLLANFAAHAVFIGEIPWYLGLLEEHLIFVNTIFVLISMLMVVLGILEFSNKPRSVLAMSLVSINFILIAITIFIVLVQLLT
ncbi:MAG: hypothetical protein A3E93_00025 [Candidatus Zambryskibacteria bacterium RIFCSPHIGHO2_12_FULL_43_12b]|uniref:Uncharacterized protein n=1 Tax=Candidatus Zambryskibacteria bacterium RIFCSPLOWO2_01_FULL_43_17 TaxID=1802760 RepID=A0A1G2U5C1_9BACT|nr:MAG: hypothetical protein A3E93_00025 [Candidatus Zambryskibacteria bacterium RIFCSPHIGHO2_12_FULL_43_12b]OHB04688.1 MAG: hypothetical protein A2920_02065 [Candidatus Zambryskibacteria bacterium RIFCSPLOWO2_01_FULL_43_17]